MARIFISYSRRDEAFARQLAGSLSDMGADIWIDVEDIPAGMKWSSAIQQGLDSAEVMIVIITPESMASRNVEDEWQYYLDHNMPVIPVLLRDAKIHFQLNRIQWVDFLNQPYDFALMQLHGELRRNGVNIALPPVSQSNPARRAAAPSAPATQDKPPVPRQAPGFERPLIIGAVVGISLLGIILVMGVGLLSGGLTTDDATEAVAITQVTAIAAENTPTDPPPTPTPTETPLNLGPVTNNADWEPIQRTIEGVAMVLVPTGRVLRGPTQSHYNANLAACNQYSGLSCERELSDELSDEQIVIGRAFWMDRTEVADGALPRVNIDWNNAATACAARAARLPNEDEWEWAAKGPSNWRFTWGNEWDFSTPRANICDAANCNNGWALANFDDGYPEQAPVDAFEAGASWVGAINLIGNVWEWTADNYPGAITNTLRGSAWTWHLGEATTTARDNGDTVSSFINTFYGYRCVRDYVAGDLERYSE